MIHPGAIIDPAAKLAPDVKVGAGTLIGPEVEIGVGSVIGPYVVLKGPTKIGKHNRIFQFASVGEDPQDKKYQGERTYLEIGDHNVIREGCTLHRGTYQDKGITRIGHHNLLMAYVHVAHDCTLGNHVILANNTALAGHVEVQDWAILGGFTGVHQFCKVGAHSMSGAGSIILKDVPAYVMVNGNSAAARGINAEGLKRRNFSPAAIETLWRAYKIIYKRGLLLVDALKEVEALIPTCPEIQLLVDSIKASTRGIVR